MSDSFGAMLGRLMQERRPKERLTQGQLAAKVWPGDSDAETKRKGDISKIETGKVANPQATTVTKIADALKITDAEIAELRRLSQLTDGEKLENIPTLSRDDLELLANRFEIEKPHARTDNDLRQLLTKKAEEYRALKAEVDAIPESMKRLANLKSAAQDAIARVDLDEVENLMSMVHESELEEAAKSAEIRANNALLHGNVDQAYTLLCSAADSFAPINPIDPASKRILEYFEPLWKHGLHYGGRGLASGEKMLRQVVTDDLKQQDAWLWAAGQNSLAIALQDQGIRAEGPAGAELLAQAVTAYRNALEVSTRADHPVDWAMTQNNLGVALKDQGIRTEGPAGADLLAQAVTANRNALEVRTRADHPVDWAMTQNNLGGALQNQGSRTEGPAGADLLAQAVTAYRNALEVRTRADHPVQWAMTQKNLAIAQGEIADHGSCPDPLKALNEALAAVDNALFVFDPEHTSFEHASAMRVRNDILAQLDALS